MVKRRREPSKRVRWMLIASLLGALFPVVGAGPAGAQDYLLGIDVARYQGTIDWNQVAESGQGYVFQKATEGVTITDPTYTRNRSGAAGVGIPFGAYHFAFAQGGSIEAAEADAVAEANYFLSVADPAPGELIPVLDLEKNPEGMPARRLIAWTRAWLGTVEAGLGVKPFIYTNPNFWETQFGNTDAFALEGYPLWIAHYTSAASPRVPANDWAGRGWAFWQYTSCASVPGISGCVDHNRFEGTDLSAYTIPGAPEPEPTPDPATPPSNTSPPTISGTPEVGRTLTASEGAWSGSQPQTYSYAWYRCAGDGTCSAVLNGTEPTYRVKSGDLGYRMRVTVTASNSAGSAAATSAPTGTVADRTAPDVPRVTKPQRERSLASTIAVAWTAVEADARYDVRYRAAPHGEGFGRSLSLRSGIATTEAQLDAEPGTAYCFSVRAADAAGNVSAWSAERCTTTAVDDRSLRASSGWTRGTGRVHYLRTFTKASRRATRLTANDAMVRGISLVAQRCPGCGRVAVLFNGRRVGAANLDARRTLSKRVIRIADLGRVRTGKLEIVVLSSGAPVKIDGLVLTRGSATRV
ncbi:MAG: GH25 family lysozyme [Actinomycetota bacterium]